MNVLIFDYKILAIPDEAEVSIPVLPAPTPGIPPQVCGRANHKIYFLQMDAYNGVFE
jgi:hypothetical protein